MPRIDEMPEYRAKLPRTSHDLSHKLGFTATVAHLLPVFHDFLNPGETIDLSFKFKLRTQPLGAAAMVDIKSHVEYFFVPMQLLYEPFGSMYYGINDNYSSFVAGADPVVSSDFPVVDFSVLNSLVAASPHTLVGFEEWANHAYRLLDMLGFNNVGLVSTQTCYNPNVFPYSLLAYHCIYQYYYRLDNREKFDQNTFNYDQYFRTTLITPSSADAQKLLRIHYRPKDSDYFTDVKISPIVDVLNLNVKDSFSLADNWLSRGKIGSTPYLTSGSEGSSGYSYINSGLSLANSNPSSKVQTNFGFTAIPPGSDTYDKTTIGRNGFDINTANIRALFANEKLWSITGRARKHYDDQTLAHFGFQVPHDVKHQISCFGHDRGSIVIGEVISTADTAASGTGASLGEIAGKGYGNLNAKSHRFTAPCHGVVMAILSFVPEITYSTTYMKANVMSSKNDLYTPEYDHLGMQPLFGFEVLPTSGITYASTIIGWQYRYEQWKRRYNRVTQAFSSNGSLSSWMLDFRPNASPNTPNSTNPIYLNGYLHSPRELDQLMLGGYVNTYSASDPEPAMYDGDPFVVDGYIDCKKVSTMSSYSLPRLDA